VTPSRRWAVVAVVGLAALSLAAVRPLAVRVTIEPVRATEDGTLMSVSIAVAPEDRGALGRDVMVWAEVARRGDEAVRKGWALKVDDPARPLMVEAVWPPGEVAVRIDLDAVGGGGHAVWWGEVVVPDLATTVPKAEPAEAEVEPEPLEPKPTPETSGEPVTEAASEPVSPPVAVVELPVPAPSAEAVAGSDGATGPQRAPSEASASPTDRAQLVQLTDAASAWLASGVGRGEITVAVIRDGVPLAGLAPADLEVVAGRNALPVVAVGGPDRAPLQLAVAVDLGTGGEAGWVGRIGAELAAGAANGRGQVLVRTSGGYDSGWGVNPASVAELISAREEWSGDDLPALVRECLGRFEGVSGRVFLVVVTDGRSDRSSSGWKETFDAAGRAGVPVLVAGIWSADFSRASRKRLSRLAEVSGGTVFYLQGAVQTGDLLERFRAVLDGSFALRLEAPPGTVGIEVRAPAAELRASSTAVR